MRHYRPATFGPAHEQYEGKHQKKHPCEKKKYFIVGKHGRLALQHAPNRGLGLFRRRGRITTSRHESSAKAFPQRLNDRISRIHVAAQDSDMRLLRASPQL